MRVNGRDVQPESDDDTPLLSVLRDELGLVGSRFGCGQSLCGACFVKVDDAVLPSCQTPLWQVAEADVTTVEGLSTNGEPHPVQQALLDHQAAQCGFCVSGIAVAAAALLDAEPDADTDRVLEVLDRNLCRCGAQRRMVAAVLAARDPQVVEPGERQRARVETPAPPPAVEEAGHGRHETPAATPPAQIATNPHLATWLTVGNDGLLEVHVGKVELGQGIVTALSQLAADAFGVPTSCLRMVPAHTSTGPDQGLTAGSLSVLQSGPALRWVGGAVRALAGPTAPVEEYVARVAALDPGTDLTEVAPAAPLPPSAVGRDEPRLDLPDKVLGRPRYLGDLRPPGLMHGRVLRPPSPSARLVSVHDGLHLHDVDLVRDGSFLGVVGARESAVDRALERLARACTWDEHDDLPDDTDLPAWLRSGEHEQIDVLDEHSPVVEEANDGHSPAVEELGHKRHETPATHTATYSKPFLAHASIAPSTAMAQWTGEDLHVWSHSQGVHQLREAIALALDLPPERVSVEHVENAGCYGHNGADDAALDAVLLARAAAGRPVLVRWSRPDELTWSPLSPAMTATLSATLDDGRITSWTHDVWGTGHSSRPGYRGTPGLLAAGHLDGAAPLAPPTDPPLPAGGGTTRNAVPLYDVGPRRVTGHRKVDTPLRSSAMRALGAFTNVFAIESFVDELAEVAGTDPVAFRLAHLADPRAAHVVETAARLGGWEEPLPDDVGRGLGFARYKDRGAWCAVVAEVEAGSDITVRRLTVVADVGLVVNPDGARNQLEGGAVQATSWATVERVRFDRRRLTTADWETYPILRFAGVPEVTCHLVVSTEPSVGAGEAAMGPTAAAIANAVHRALGVRVRDLPLTPEAVVAAIENS